MALKYRYKQSPSLNGGSPRPREARPEPSRLVASGGPPLHHQGPLFAGTTIRGGETTVRIKHCSPYGVVLFISPKEQQYIIQNIE